MEKESKYFGYRVVSGFLRRSHTFLALVCLLFSVKTSFNKSHFHVNCELNELAFLTSATAVRADGFIDM